MSRRRPGGPGRPRRAYSPVPTETSTPSWPGGGWRRGGTRGGLVGVGTAGGRGAVLDFLRGSGRQRIVFVGAEQETSAGKERLAAFRARARPGDGEILLPKFSTSAGRDAATELLRAGN